VITKLRISISRHKLSANFQSPVIDRFDQ